MPCKVLPVSLISSTNNMKINCTEKITINTPLQQVSGDVHAGGANVSLITHVHPQPNTGADATSQGDTKVAIGRTGRGT